MKVSCLDETSGEYKVDITSACVCNMEWRALREEDGWGDCQCSD